MTKFVKLRELRAIALADGVVCDVATAIRNSLEAHTGHKDGHLVSVPDSISCLIGLPEEEVTKMLVPVPVIPAVAPVVSPVAPVISEPAPPTDPVAAEVPPAPLTPDPLG
jgi:hypothetical protein